MLRSVLREIASDYARRLLRLDVKVFDVFFMLLERRVIRCPVGGVSGFSLLVSRGVNSFTIYLSDGRCVYVSLLFMFSSSGRRTLYVRGRYRRSASPREVVLRLTTMLETLRRLLLAVQAFIVAVESSYSWELCHGDRSERY